MASSEEDDVMDNAADLEDDLLGDDDEEPIEKVRELSDRELDSGDDEERNDRAPRDDAEEIDYADGRAFRFKNQPCGDMQFRSQLMGR